jgi:chromosome segregation ATPase
MSFSVSTMCSEVSPSTSLTSAHYQVLSDDASYAVTPTQVVETCLTQVGLDNASFSTALIKQMTDLQTSFREQRGKLNGRIQGLITTSETLQLQLTTAQTQSESDLAQRDGRLTALETENKQLQDQMAKLIADQTEENKRKQKQLDDARKNITQSLETNQAGWDFHVKSYNSQIQSLQTQLSALQPKCDAAEKEKTHLSSTKARLDNQMVSLRAQQESLQKTAHEEPARQKAAVKAKITELKQAILNTFDREIGTYTIQAAILKAKLPAIPETDIGNAWQARVTAPDGTSYNPVAAIWATSGTRRIVVDYLTE